ncbi:SAV_2336 N-terminal domain-related protein [Streptomyces sp. NPDC058622]|uniref:SAV_2336 N-terminal domain-related protein n=1 Tax=Streptomyces sp. NPDC058622 TaxID=3346562 RepID=UPI00366404E6
MIEELLRAIADARVDAGTNELADILWLSAHLTSSSRPSEATTGDTAAGDADEPEPQSSSAEEPLQGAGSTPSTGTRLFTATQEGVAEGRRGSLVKVRRAAALDDAPAMMRALRPVGRRRVGGSRTELDEELTVVRSIEEHMLLPVLRPSRGHWLDLALVVDTHRSMLLWQDLVDELCRVISQTGVFRDVRVWFLRGTDSDGTPAVAHAVDGQPRSPLEISDPSGRRVILVVTDTVGQGWGTSALEDVFRHWSSHNSVAILNVLPERLWTRGAVRPSPLLLRVPTAAAPNTSWQLAPINGRRSLRRSGLRSARIAVPVVEATPESLSSLAHLVVGNSRWTRMLCLGLDTCGEPGALTTPVAGADTSKNHAAPADAKHVLARFREGASPTAQELAGYLSAVPLTLPVMTLVRRAMIPHSKHAHLAEVVLGGLFQPWHTGPGDIDSSQLEFQFLPGVREALVGAQLREEITSVREIVRRSVWRYLTQRTGPASDFQATEVTSGDFGDRIVAPDALAFAQAASAPQPASVKEPRDSYATEPVGDHVVMVEASTGQQRAAGTGLLLTRRLVLVPAHLVNAVGPPVTVTVVSGDRRIGCRTEWPGRDAPHTAALVLAEEDIVDAAGSESFAPPRWGEIVSSTDLPVPCSVLGFLGRSGVRSRVAGSLSPGVDSTREKYVVVTSREPEPSQAPAIGHWAGMSGSPVTAQGVLLGLVVSSSFKEVDELEVLPVSVLLRDSDFVRIVTRHLGSPPELEPVPTGLPVPPHEGAILGGPEDGTDLDWLCLAINVRSTGPKGSSRHLPQDAVLDAELRVRHMLEGILSAAGFDATVAEGTDGSGADLLAGLTTPILAEAVGQIVLGLSDGLAVLNSSRTGRARIHLGVAITSGPGPEGDGDLRGNTVDEAVRMLATRTIRRRVQDGLSAKSRSREVVLVVSQPVLDSLVSRVGAESIGDFRSIAADDPILSQTGALVYSGNPSALGRAVIDPPQGLTRRTDPGQPSSVLDAAIEDVIRFRQLARVEPDSHRPGLARALMALGAEVRRLGRQKAALAAISEAVAIWEDFASETPDIFLDPLVDTLREQSTVCRELAVSDPATYRPRLAESLQDLGRSLGDLDRYEEGQAAVAEAVEINRELSVSDPATYLPRFAESLYDLGNLLVELGRGEEALAAIKMSLHTYRQLTLTRPGFQDLIDELLEVLSGLKGDEDDTAG